MNKKYFSLVVLTLFIILVSVALIFLIKNNKQEDKLNKTAYPLFANSTLESELNDAKRDKNGKTIKICTYLVNTESEIQNPVAEYEKLLKKDGWEVLKTPIIEECTTSVGKAQNATDFLDYRLQNFCKVSASYPGFTYTISIYPR